jgi:hypothetical protein
MLADRFDQNHRIGNNRLPPTRHHLLRQSASHRICVAVIDSEAVLTSTTSPVAVSM